MSVSLQPLGLYVACQAPLSMEFSRQEYWSGCSHSFLQRLFPTQESNWGLPHCRCILYQLSHRQSPKILEWAAYPFSRGSSQPRNQTGVSCIAGGLIWLNAQKQSYYVIYIQTGGTVMKNSPSLTYFRCLIYWIDILNTLLGYSVSTYQILTPTI